MEEVRTEGRSKVGLALQIVSTITMAKVKTEEIDYTQAIDSDIMTERIGED